MSNQQNVKLFLKGVLMGLADIVPGVSGGTIALITGIYEELVFSINSIRPIEILKNILKLNKNELIQSLRKINHIFLIILGSGIFLSIFLASKAILFALNNFPVYTFSFFFGLILLSAVKIYGRIDHRKSLGIIISLLIGSISAFFITGIKNLGLIHSPIIVFLSGSLAILAMILPGISGSFILLIIGQYEYMLNVLHNLSTKYMRAILFILGAIISLFAFTDLLSYILNKYENITLSFLTGLMLGALRLPGQKIFFAKTIYPKIGFTWNIKTISLTILFFSLGAIFVYLIEK